MAQTAFSIRMDEGLKRDFSQFCENIGMTMSTAFVVFAKAALRNRRIPFEIYDYRQDAEDAKSMEIERIRQSAREAFDGMRAQVQAQSAPKGAKAPRRARNPGAANASTRGV